MQVHKQLGKNGNYSDKELQSSQKLKENLIGGRSIKTNMYNQIQLDIIDNSLEDDTFAENRNMKLNSINSFNKN